MYLKIKQVFTLITISVSHTDCKHNSQPGKNCVHGLQIKLIMVVGFFLLFLFSFVIYLFFFGGRSQEGRAGPEEPQEAGDSCHDQLGPQKPSPTASGCAKLCKEKKKKRNNLGGGKPIPPPAAATGQLHPGKKKASGPVTAC